MSKAPVQSTTGALAVHRYAAGTRIAVMRAERGRNDGFSFPQIGKQRGR